jgi:hypothetical protein
MSVESAGRPLCDPVLNKDFDDRYSARNWKCTPLSGKQLALVEFRNVPADGARLGGRSFDLTGVRGERLFGSAEAGLLLTHGFLWCEAKQVLAVLGLEHGVDGWQPTLALVLKRQKGWGVERVAARGAEVFAAAWSPQCDQLAFLAADRSEDAGDRLSGDAFLHRADGSLTSLTKDQEMIALAWKPGGQYLALGDSVKPRLLFFDSSGAPRDELDLKQKVRSGKQISQVVWTESGTIDVIVGAFDGTKWEERETQRVIPPVF